MNALITSDIQRRTNGFDVVRATSKEVDGKCISFVASDLLPGQAIHDNVTHLRLLAESPYLAVMIEQH